MPERKAGLLGRLPGKMPVGLHTLDYYVAGALPKPPSTVEVPNAPGFSTMLGNDQVGDCGVAGLEHLLMATAAITSETEEWPNDNQAVDYYFKYTKGQDSGVVLADFLGYVRQEGYYGHHVHAYAPVAVQNIPLLQTSIYLYGASYTGITVTASMQTAFERHQPWTTAELIAPPIGGHCVPLVAYSDNYLYCVTWGGIQAITYPAWHLMATEAWAVMTGELMAHHGDGRGVNESALLTDLNQLG